jgi:hypothetical protein
MRLCYESPYFCMGKARTYSTLSLEAIGFGLVIFVICADEYLDLPHLLFGAPVTPVRISEVLFEAGMTLLLGGGVIVTSWRMNQRIAHLERLLLICASCRRVEVDGQWLAFEAYIKQRDQLLTSHGVCPTCFEHQMAELDRGGTPAPLRL